jgi:solute carrier family 25 (mitochondrial carnitine/acylcarnitine transporter), member 20/29
LRQHLFYHLINYTIPLLPPNFPVQRPLILETLHYPGSPAEEPPPWLPAPGGLLNSIAWAGVDFSGRGGIRIIKETITASNGIIVPVEDVIPLPGNLYQEIQAHPLLSEFVSILTPGLAETLSTTPHITLFFPIDSAWSALDSIERQYLHSGYAERDVGRLVAMHSSGSGVNSSGDIGWSDTWNQGAVCTY